MPRRGRMVAGWPADLAVIGRDVGSLLAMESLLMAVSVLVAIGFGEWYAALAFFIAAGATAGVGLGARKAFDEAPAPRMKHGMIIAAAGWFATAAFGSLPFFLTAHFAPDSVFTALVPAGVEYTQSSLVYFRNPLHALFESMSGWTGSGLTMGIHEPSLPRTIQWWRSLIQWVGGVGVIVLTVSILSRPGSGSYALYRGEAREEKIHPSVVSTVRTVWKIFVGYTVLSVVVLFVAIRASNYGSALPLWEAGWQALNHAMTGLSTGGFAVTDNSIGTYNSPLIETVLLPIMALGAIAFPIHYTILRNREVDKLWTDLQTRWLLAIFAVGVAGLTIQNLVSLPTTAGSAFVETADYFGLSGIIGGPETDAIRDSAFHWVSALSCTGFQAAPLGQWSDGGKLLLSGAMTLGGAAGSTVGGIKIIRGYTISRGIQWQFSRVFLPESTVVNIEMNGRRLSRSEMDREFSEAAIVSMLWVLLLVASSVLLVNLAGPEFTYADALFEVASAQGNVGISTGITGPSMNPYAEAMFLFNMWIGRLEIIPVLVFFRSVLYGLNP
ncbi:TrkH family potassium uptake protein [Haloferax mediterranei ATCC 33500]|uniref:Potassium transporter Trk n=1 Tax=Haloferax mediterranei (strain ATCC 33500 / DSM 1411 / JCM 8866 / NBRC 14739 / NCIMB 2177 / R-4) TaxID=523841 RepID=I3R3G2_HALMT|nr:TrkH family potassium uptake protein [Haloferax mediterranei]AFK18772.1 Trk potassium uptake system protein [Haloferax mediterranei ATCC 33500]AHZ21859.1 potassium transporter Trk [Haloferax mediterranei ATCC 33500]EMA03368.1 Trk potassium uptake system protein [Haloferax mediterranei ATCC 33500]MDX5988868.1 TrkH family potassium uptake protein [Haloferax mediterranei ATCC 33500]QCQ75266.1 TrkH family potassium uptake protein [Haloferax mediterranei ATCC 33500]